MNIASTSPDLRRSLAVTALALLPLTLAGCGVVAVAGSVAGAAITVGSAAVSVGATVVSTGVKVTGKAIGKTLDAVSGEPAAAAEGAAASSWRRCRASPAPACRHAESGAARVSRRSA